MPVQVLAALCCVVRVLLERGSPAEHDVEASGQLADLGLLDGLEGNDDRGALAGVADAVEHAVASVLRVARHINLRREQLLAALPDAEVDVRRASGVGNGLDGAEEVLAILAGLEAPVALEVGVVARVAVARVDVGAIAIDLPDLDQRPRDRLAARPRRAR